MKKLALVFLLLTQIGFSQTNISKAKTKGGLAIKLMEEGNYDESIKLLEECETLDPKNFVYPYEIAYALFLQKEYKKAIKVLDKTKEYKSATALVYQMSGNCYSYNGKKEKAIEEYNLGIKKFPKSGILHLEKGNVYLMQKKYNEAIESYENGIQAEPTYSTNYYRLAQLFMGSTDKLSGLMYGEMFMNIEMQSKRSQEISEMLYKTYQSAIILKKDASEIKFCDIIIDPSQMDGKELKLPFCAVFGKNFILTLIDTETGTLNLKSLIKMRKQFITNYFEEDYKDTPNLLFDYHKKIIDLGFWNQYNYFIFQLGSPAEFSEYLDKNREDFTKFANWFSKKENQLEVTPENIFVR